MPLDQFGQVFTTRAQTRVFIWEESAPSGQTFSFPLVVLWIQNIFNGVTANRNLCSICPGKWEKVRVRACRARWRKKGVVVEWLCDDRIYQIFDKCVSRNSFHMWRWNLCASLLCVEEYQTDQNRSMKNGNPLVVNTGTKLSFEFLQKLAEQKELIMENETSGIA